MSSNAPWTEVAREFIVTTNPRCLDLAVSSCDDKEIVAFLRNSDLEANKYIDPAVFAPLVTRLDAENRCVEACVVHLLGFRFVALAMSELETYDKARREFIDGTCTDLAGKSTAFGFMECEALFVGLLAIGAAKLRRDKDSFSLFDRSISLARQVVASGATQYVPLLAGAIGGLGNALRFAGHTVKAIEALSDSVKLRRQCFGHDLERNQRQLASSLSDLAAGFAAANRFREAETALVEAVGIHKRLPQDKPKARASLAGALSNLSLLHTEQRRFHAAKIVSEEVLAIRRQLAAEMPEVYLADLATSLSNLGMLLDDLRDFNGAVAALREAIAIRRSLAQDQPLVFNPDLATSLNNLGNVLQITGNAEDVKAAMQAYNEAFDIRRTLAEHDYDLYQPAVVQTIGNMAALRCLLGQHTKAIAGFQEVITAILPLAQRDIATFAPKLAGAYGNLGSVLFRTGRYSEARQSLEVALELWRRLAAVESDAYDGQLAGTLNDLAVCLSRLGPLSTALPYARESVRIAERTTDHSFLTKGDVFGAYCLLIMDAAMRGVGPEVFAGAIALRNPSASLVSEDACGRLLAIHSALMRIAGNCGKPVHVIVVEKLLNDSVLFAVVSSESSDVQYEVSERFIESASALASILHDPFTDTAACKRGVSVHEVTRLARDLWLALPSCVRMTLDPGSDHDVLICGDPDSLDLPWEAVRFGEDEDNWLGLFRHLTRLPYLSVDVLEMCTPEVCGGESRSAVVLCPFDLPNQVVLTEAKAEALEVAELLHDAGYKLQPACEPLIGQTANVDAFSDALVSSPAILHFAGHGDIERNEIALILWNVVGDGDVAFDRRRIAELNTRCERSRLLTSRPLIVLNSCWAGRSSHFGGQREDLAASLLSEGASCVIASPTPVHDDVGRMLATLLYVPEMQDKRGLAFTFQRVRSLVAQKCCETAYWWTWFWMRFQGNPFARLDFRRGLDDQLRVRKRVPKALQLVREFVELA